MKNRDIVIVSIQPWDLEIAGNSKNLALEFARNNRVLFVNYALDRITRFKEKPQSPKPQKGWVSTGWYIFSPEIFEHVPSGNEPISLEKDVFPKIARMDKVGAYKIIPEKDERVQWFDVGTFERYKTAMDEWNGS